MVLIPYSITSTTGCIPLNINFVIQQMLEYLPIMPGRKLLRYCSSLYGPDVARIRTTCLSEIINLCLLEAPEKLLDRGPEVHCYRTRRLRQLGSKLPAEIPRQASAAARRELLNKESTSDPRAAAEKQQIEPQAVRGVPIAACAVTCGAVCQADKA